LEKHNWRRLFIYGFPFFCFFLIGISLAYNDLGFIFELKETSLLHLGMIIGSFFLLLLTLKRIFQKEKITLSPTHLTISKDFAFFENKYCYTLNDIKDLGHSIVNFTKHNFSNEGFDYLGFQGGEKQIQHQIEDGKLKFFYKGGIIEFGRDLSSEQQGEVIRHLKDRITTTRK
jgi:hypothetical protein